MPPITQGTFHVYTYKDGLLSSMAHDLRLRLEKFEVQREGDALTGRFRLDSLVVEGCMKSGQLDTTTLSAKDVRDIEENMREKILHIAQHPEARFTARVSGSVVEGTLALSGREAPVRLTVTEAGGRYTGSVELQPTHWGIAPFKALMGAIKLQDRVTIEFDLVA